MKKILIVDDIELNRLILKDLFLDKYDVLEAENGSDALKLIKQYDTEIGAVLLDLVMPVMSGFEVLEELDKTGILKRIPVIIITGEAGDEKALKGYSLGVSDIIEKPINPEVVSRRVDNVIDLYAHKNFMEQKLQEQKAELIKQDQELKQNNLFLIDAMAATIEFRSMESGEHVKRIRYLTQIFLEMINDLLCYSDSEIEKIASASILHDIGKIAIPDSILLKPGRLTNEEFDVMKTHTTLGVDILRKLEFMPDHDYYQYCYDICRHHHERWDGRGYPDGLKGDEIPIAAQAASLADVYDALVSDRVYKKSYTHDEAVKMILNNECGVFNPLLMDRFEKNGDKLPELIQEMYSRER